MANPPFRANMIINFNWPGLFFPLNKNSRTAEVAQTVQARLLLLTGVSVIGAYLLSKLYELSSPPDLSTINLIVDHYKNLVFPEPGEQFVFVFLAALIPLLALIISRVPVQSLDLRIPQALPILIATCFLLPFFGSDFLTTLLRDYSLLPVLSDSLILLASLGMALLACLRIKIVKKCPRNGICQLKPVWRYRSLVSTICVWTIFAAAVLMQCMAWRWVTMAAVTKSYAWAIHADPVFYVLAQVTSGKTLLADLPSQYGLFPELIAPFLNLTGRSVASVTSWFALMQISSMFGLFWFMSKVVKSRNILLLAGLTLVLITFETVLYFAGLDERYYQYWPLRFFWPAMSVVFVYLFAVKPTILRSTICSLTGALGLCWNMDSGLFVVIGFAGLLLGHILLSGIYIKSQLTSFALPSRNGFYLKCLGIHIILVVLLVASLLLILSQKSAYGINGGWIFEYQKVFTRLGLAMIPLPQRLDPWMSILGVYLASFLMAFSGLAKQSGPNVKADMYLYLAMLGLGLFVYYVGRSHVLNLVTVCWPAVLIMAMAVDDLVRGVKLGKLPKSSLAIPAVSFAMMITASGSLFSRTPGLAGAVAAQYELRGVFYDPVIKEELTFIRQHASPGTECFILSQRQGIYALEAQLPSPFVGPGLVETVLKRDEQKLAEQIARGSFPCLFVGDGMGTAISTLTGQPTDLSAYKEVARSSGGSMVYYNPAPR